MIFIKSSTRIAKYFKREVVNDVLNTLARNRRAFGPGGWIVVTIICETREKTDLFSEMSNRPRNWRREV